MLTCVVVTERECQDALTELLRVPTEKASDMMGILIARFREEGRREVYREIAALKNQHQFDQCNEMGYCQFCGTAGDETCLPTCLFLRAHAVTQEPT